MRIKIGKLLNLTVTAMLENKIINNSYNLDSSFILLLLSIYLRVKKTLINIKMLPDKSDDSEEISDVNKLSLIKKSNIENPKTLLNSIFFNNRDFKLDKDSRNVLAIIKPLIGLKL
ncbi:hypothetical protein myaer102_47270 [Microcystis viridis NIES-102]|uniref:Uncharacterized protein n=1 Tax=Microcystis viridis NIES-102 TaxID=213615 RepID=A0A3G9JPW1_MICVR|nr:hypothetical protein myaer102_47270 [Microcystis viridis NIES-102]